MSMSNPTRRVVRWIVLLVVFTAVVVLMVVAVRSFSDKSNGRSGMEETPSAAPTTSPTEGIPHEEADLPEAIADNPYDCKLHMSSEEYASFTQRLMKYEAIRLLNSKDKVEQLTPFATEDFLRTQTNVGTDVVNTVNLSLESPSPFGCYTDDSAEITAYANPFVTITDSVTGEVQKRHQPLSTHSTQWIKVGGSWYVNQERF